MTSALPINPASSHVRRARRAGLTNTLAKLLPAKVPANAFACSSPSGRSGISDRPVWRPFLLHSVAPWRNSQTSLLWSMFVLMYAKKNTLNSAEPWHHALVIRSNRSPNHRATGELKPPSLAVRRSKWYITRHAHSRRHERHLLSLSLMLHEHFRPFFLWLQFREFPGIQFYFLRLTPLSESLPPYFYECPTRNSSKRGSRKKKTHTESHQRPSLSCCWPPKA